MVWASPVHLSVLVCCVVMAGVATLLLSGLLDVLAMLGKQLRVDRHFFQTAIAILQPPKLTEGHRDSQADYRHTCIRLFMQADGQRPTIDRILQTHMY